MQAVVLAGGRGQRLHPLTTRVPKPLIPVMGRPLLGHLLDHLENRGIDEVFVTAGYLGSEIVRFLDAAPRLLPVHVVQEPAVRGTAGAVADLLPALRGPFLVISGDAVVDLDVARLRAAHTSSLAIATICAAPPQDRVRFGVIATHGSLVETFVEKPALEDLLPGLVVNTGCYLLEPEALEGVAAHGAVDFARDVFPRLLLQGARVATAPGLRYWRDIGTAEAFRDIHLEAASGSWPWSASDRAAPPHLGRDASVIGPAIFGSGVTLGTGARLLGPVYVGDRVSIGAHARVARSVLLAHSRIGTHAEVEGTVVDCGSAVACGTAVSGALISRVDRPLPHAVPRMPACS